jgi:hypothetical protein
MGAIVPASTRCNGLVDWRPNERLIVAEVAVQRLSLTTAWNIKQQIICVSSYFEYDHLPLISAKQIPGGP